MSARKPPRAKRPEPIEAPAMPAKTEEEQRDSQRLVAMMQEMTKEIRLRNLNAALRLAQQAVAGRGPLVEHFAELGRRFAHTLNEQPQRPKFEVIAGGRP
jgi:hypothetical protein